MAQELPCRTNLGVQLGRETQSRISTERLMPRKSKSSETEDKGFTLRNVPDETVEETATSGGTSPRDYHDLGELPRSYGEEILFLVAQEPHRLFTYWDIDISKHPGGPCYLRACTANDEVESEITVSFETRNWYLPVKHAGTEYYVELGYYRAGQWQSIARSEPTTTPPEGVSASEAFDFATLPFHLSFQRLIDNLQAARESGDDLLAAVAAMQRAGDFEAFGALGLPSLLTEDQKLLLQTLLGSDFLEQLTSGALSSADIEKSIRGYLAEKLSSAGASEFLAEFHKAVSSTSSLFSGVTLVPSSEMLTSWGITELSSWATSAITSWMSMASWMLAGETSWGAESSWTFPSVAAGSWMQTENFSWSAAGGSSWGAETSAALAALGSLTSWMQKIQSSWAGAALSSWSSGEVSSWFSAENLASWSGASESVSSFSSQRGFYMHVNAEVIFYGGTDPKAKVTIGGKPIALNPDGTFRYHFVFPDGDFEIPIVATSPDGVETRSATLKFVRNSARHGEVTDTPQPPLGEPMGRIPA